MILFKAIEIDLAAERARIAKVKLNRRQRAALVKLVDLFEAGKWQECLDHVNDEQAFPYNEEDEYHEREHIGIQIGDVLRDLGYATYYTQDELLRQIITKTHSGPVSAPLHALGRPVHLHRTGSFGACGTSSALQASDWRKVECLRCRRTRHYRLVRAASRRAEMDSLLRHNPL